jgi:putative nucleotidyltransferase with HDIG domain
MKELDQIIDSMDEEIDAVRKRKLRLAAALHDIAKPPTRTVDDSGRVRFFGHPKSGVEMAKKILEEIGETDTAIIVKIVEMHMDILFKADELRRGLLKKEERAVNKFLNKIGNGLEDLYLVAQANVNSIVRPEGAKVVPGRDWEKFKSDMEEHIDYQRQWMEKARAAYKKRNIDEPDLGERKLTPGESKKREEYAKDLPDDEFKERYGKDWMSVKMATATKMAKK